MTRHKSRLESLVSIFRSWGGLPELGDAHAPRREAVREVWVCLPTGQKRMHVGTLSCEEGEYVFAYSPEFKQQTEIPPISAFPDVGDPYRSPELWPFFQVRVPPLDRDDVRELLAAKGIRASDLLGLLVEVSARAATSPYQLELREHPAAA